MSSPRQPLSEEDLNKISGGNTGNSDAYAQVLQQIAGVQAEIENTIQEFRDLTQKEGTSGNDFLEGTGHNDTFRGGGGSDVMVGGAGADIFYANDGDGAADFALGGAGDDIYVWSPGSGSDAFFGEAGFDSVVVHNMTIDQLRMSFVPETPGQMWRITQTADAFFITCERPGGEPQSFNGSIIVGGERLVLNGVERLIVPR
jgi:hypothetical protein